jgi:NAD(P)-dependent dehydrogenase (short-subunit alcohol dehydrogenase family)
MAQRMQGRVALVTGRSSGIGRATALAFAREGARVAIADIAAERCQETAAEIKGRGGEAICIETDVSQPDQVQALVSKVVETYGQLDDAFNNAGIEGDQAPLGEGTEENWDRVIAINLKGLWLSIKYEIAQMLQQGGGAFVNMTSVAGLVGYPSSSAYVASKHGVLGLTKTAALDYATEGISRQCRVPWRHPDRDDRAFHWRRRSGRGAVGAPGADGAHGHARRSGHGRGMAVLRRGIVCHRRFSRH